MKRLSVLVAMVAVALVGAPAAFADSIAYVKDGNVWLSTGDGSRQFQVTSGGGYSDVSQADDGTMIALSGVRLRKLDRLGNVLADFATPVSDTRPAPAKTFYGPFDPAISPDGGKVAYTYYYMTQSQSPTCFPPTCVTTINEAGTGYSYSDRMTSWNEPGLGYHSGWLHPSWVDNDMTMLSEPSHMPNNDVILDRISDGGNGHGNLVMNWFSDLVGNNPHVSGGDISRDRSKLAFVTGESDSTLTVYSVPAFPTFVDGETNDKPIVCYRYSGPQGGHFGTPTFAPDGGRVAWATADGVHVAAVPSFGGGCTTAGATQTPPLVIPGGSEPDWGPADVPASRPAPATSSTPPPAPSSSSALAVSLKRSRHAITVRVTAPVAGRLSAVAKARGKVVGKAAKTVKKGRVKLVVRLKGHPRNVKVTVTLKPKSGASQSGSASIR